METFLLTASGLALLLVVAYDVYSTILDDRPQVGPVSHTLNRTCWRAAHLFSRRLTRTRRHQALNLVGPLLLPLLFVAYLALLVGGFALVYYPHMPAEFVVAEGASRSPLAGSLYYSGVTLTTVGYGDIAPRSKLMRFVAVCESAAGLALVTLVITYLIAVYGALERKRAVALSFYHQAEEGANVAGFITHHFVAGRFYGLVEVLRDAARNLHGVFESHVEHPIIHFFHSVQVYKSMPRVLFLTLETCAVLRSCLDEEKYPETCSHPEVRTLEASARHVLAQFVGSLKLKARRRADGEGEFEESRRWRRRYEGTLRRLGAAGVAVRPDAAAGWEEYRANREEWEAPLKRFADHLGYDWDEVTGDRDLRYAADDGMEEPEKSAEEKAEV
ncbi:MAG TPA: potassium channel family protein [Pyrinomonadaceae bacterium]